MVAAITVFALASFIITAYPFYTNPDYCVQDSDCILRSTGCNNFCTNRIAGHYVDTIHSICTLEDYDNSTMSCSCIQNKCEEDKN